MSRHLTGKLAPPDFYLIEQIADIHIMAMDGNMQFFKTYFRDIWLKFALLLRGNLIVAF